jgi:hypothetical protein
MIIIDRNERFFGGDDGETITVVVKSQNTNHGVTYSLDGKSAVMPSTGAQSSALTFKLNKAVKDPSTLLMMFHFANTGGNGIYIVVITGNSPGGKPFGEVIRQLGVSDIVSSRGYTFDVI